MEAVDGVLGILPSNIPEESINTLQEAASADTNGSLWNYGPQRNVVDGELQFVFIFSCYPIY